LKKKIHFRNLEDTLYLLGTISQKGSVPLERIFKVLSGKGRYFVIFILSLPFCVPIQIPGLSTPFGILISLIGLRILIDKDALFPQKLLNKKISSKVLKNISKKGLWIVKKLKKFIHPRMDVFCHSAFSKYINGVLIVLLGLILALPLPIPFSNLLAAWSLFGVCVGLLEDDGLFVVIGYILTLVTIAFLFLTGLFITHSIH
jgi:hypothetical protein